MDFFNICIVLVCSLLCVLKGSHYQGHMVYKVKYRNKNERSKTEWVYAEDLPVELRKDFHIKYTFSGKRH